MFRVWEWLRKSGWKWLRENIVKAIVLAALTASVTGWLKGTFDTILRESLPSAAEISCIGREWIVRPACRTSSNPRFSRAFFVNATTFPYRC